MKKYNINKNLKITVWLIIIGIFLVNFFSNSSAKPKIGIALGEGGERLFVHIGVLKALEKEGIEIDCIAGTSAGAIVGGLYALWKDTNKVEKFLLDFDFTRFYNYQIKDIELRDIGESIFLLFFWELGKDKIEPGWLLGLMDGKEIRNEIDRLTNWATFEHDLKIPFKTLATDLVKGEKVIFEQGRISNAIAASLSIPGTFRPFEWEGKILVDGGIVEVVPIETARTLGADFVIAVSVSSSLKKKYEFNNAVEILFRSDEITSNYLRRLQLSFADVVITPKVGRFHWSDFSKPEKCIREGEIAAQSSILEIKKKLKQKRGIWWKRLFPSLK